MPRYPFLPYNIRVNAMNSCVTFRRASAALIIALAALLALASCNKQQPQTKQPTPVIQKPSASLLAADIAKLGFIPGRAVALPSDFKAEGKEMGSIGGFNFSNGFYLVDSDKRLTCASLYSPQSLMPGGVRPGMTKEQAEAMKKKSLEDNKSFGIGEKPFGYKIPPEELSSVKFNTWRNKDLFSLSPDELFSIYGPPSRPLNEPTKDTIQLGEGVAPYTYSFRMAEYIYQVGPDEYWAVRISLSKFVGRPEIVDSMTMIGFEPSEMQPLSDYKVYPWPGLYPEAVAK
jgi:hypothetical protein